LLSFVAEFWVVELLAGFEKCGNVWFGVVFF